MNWKFWKKASNQNGVKEAKPPKAAKPRDIPEAVGRKMVVSMKIDPDVVWALKYVSRPVEGHKKAQEFRIFSSDKAFGAGVTVKDWSSLDNRPDLILYSGCYDRETEKIDFSVS